MLRQHWGSIRIPISWGCGSTPLTNPPRITIGHPYGVSDLGDTEFPVGFKRMFMVFPIVAVPEGTVHEDDELVIFETDVRFAVQWFLRGFVPDSGLP